MTADHESIFALFEATVARRGDSPALGVIEAGQIVWISWHELSEQVRNRAAALKQLGIVAADRVVQRGPNSVEWILNDLALQSLRAAHVPLHSTMEHAALQWHVDHAEPRVVLTPGTAIESTPLRPTTTQSPADLATLLYTSGTTGTPLGVMLSWQNMVANAIAVSETAGGSGDEIRLAFLPFSHAYARTCDLNAWLHRGSRLVLSRGREFLRDDLQLVKPTALTGVPYLFEKLASNAAGEKLRELLGGEIQRCYSGGAPLAPRVVEHYAAAGLALLDGYGLTEAAPVVAMSTTDDNQAGTVGRPLRNIEVKLADDGEIMVRGPSVMLGYWQNKSATDVVLQDGWLHTGDLGEWDESGRLRIIGRRKEIIALSTGKKIAPSAIESRLAASPWIEQVVVVGDGQSHLAALIVPNPDRLKHLIRERRLWVWSKRRAASHPVVRSVYQQVMDECLADMPVATRPHRFTIVTRAFSADAGEITAKLSLRRNVIAKRFAREIAAMYNNSQ